jgi:hypothetical protein
MSGHPRFYQLLDELKDLHDRKNADYSEEDDPLSNLRLCELFGIPAWKGVLVRISDKWSRVAQLASGREALVKDESVIDTLKDMAVYALLCIILFEEKNEPLPWTSLDFHLTVEKDNETSNMS